MYAFAAVIVTDLKAQQYPEVEYSKSQHGWSTIPSRVPVLVNLPPPYPQEI